ncbi:PREDICTED: glutamate receptor 2.8-like [Erythranthe guttata]|uniref:glutamate receptor 2.8-like n=1 Tax=Erythranthe guttata TaxID=4155 RepID=UPI00064D8233|nr:PREDICTED: glutamate receptor 2.8-like [Erythranthe guttata]|eukprot:XP_012831250.1 PREDICTED: glutamate receptor 2.8-like [Erythranthe guttata]
MRSTVGIGLVLDMNSTFGTMVNMCMDMAVSDFYKAHPNHITRLQLHKKDAKSVLDVNVAVLELVKNEEVCGIFAPHGSKQEAFAAAIGETVRLPIISFTARSSSVSYEENRYIVRTASDDAVQSHALASICQKFEWPEVVILYEDDTEYGNNFVSRTINVLHDAGIEVPCKTSIATSASDSHILKELKMLKKKKTRVFLVHAGPGLGSRLFAIASNAGMMKEGYAWVVTDSLSIFLDSVDFSARDSMDGVLGIRPYLFASKKLKSFQERWKRNMLLNNNTSGSITEVNINGLWVYDAVTALAIAIENIRRVNSSLLDLNGDKNRTDNRGLRISVLGPMLLRELSNTKFRGLAGDFELVDGKLKVSAFEIFNIIGNGERKLGFWTIERGIIRELNSSFVEPTNSISTNELKNVLWPGNSVVRPKGRAILETEDLRIGIPWKPGFIEFVNVHHHVDIFLAALKVLPLPINYEFRIYNDSKSSNWSYDSMLHKIPEEYDMVVADTTIWAPRAEYVDFSLPYSESGAVLVVKNKKPLNMWIFIKPLRWDLWLAIAVASILLGLVLCILERRAIEPNGMTYWFPIAFLVFPESKIFVLAFPIGSPLVAYFSRVILNVTQGSEMSSLEQKNFGPGYSSQDPLSSVISQGTSSLSLREFGGLFIITGSLIAFALVYSESEAIGHFIQNYFSSFWTPHIPPVESVRQLHDHPSQPKLAENDPLLESTGQGQ